MTSTWQQVHQCPECHLDYDTKEGSKRFPTSCRWCFHTVCAVCVTCTKHKQNKGTTATSKPCRKCGKGGAFYTNALVAHQLSCKLIEQIRLLQEQNAQLSKQQKAGAGPEPKRLPVLRSRQGLVSDGEDQSPTAGASHEEESSEQEEMWSGTSSISKSPPQTNDGDFFATGTPVCCNGRCGTILSSTPKRLYALQYGDGDPEWVPFKEMTQSVLAAHSKLNYGSPEVEEEDGLEEEQFLGQDVYREFPKMGGYWGKVVKCQWKYAVVFQGSRQEVLVSEDQLRQWVFAARNQGRDVSLHSNQKSSEPTARNSSPAKNAPTKRKLSQNCDEPNQAKISAPQTKKARSVKEKTVIKLCEQRHGSATDGHPSVALTSAKDDTATSRNFTVAAPAIGTGWKGFEKHISESTLPSSLREILQLMDALFVVAQGEDGFVASLWERSFKTSRRYGFDVQHALRTLQKKNPDRLQWHQKRAPYVPNSKDNLADLIETILGLKISPRLQSPDSTKRCHSKLPLSSMTKVLVNVGDLENLNLPATHRGKGWKGFNTIISQSNLPQQFRQVFLLIDFFFPVAAGEESFVFRLYDKCGLGSNRSTAGKGIRRALNSLKQKTPGLAGIKWHTPASPYVPGTKKDLAAFMDLLMNMSGAPKLANPQLSHMH